MKRLVAAFALFGVLAGCGHMPISTMVALRKFDFATFEPAAMAVGVRGPDVIQPRAGGVTITVELWRKGHEGGKKTSVFVLRQSRETALLERLAIYRTPRTALFAYQLEDADVARIKALQAEGLEQKKKFPGESMMTFTIKAEACRTGDLPEGALATTIYLQVDPAQGFLVFLKDVDLRAEVKPSGKSIEQLVPVCAP